MPPFSDLKKKKLWAKRKVKKKELKALARNAAAAVPAPPVAVAAKQARKPKPKQQRVVTVQSLLQVAPPAAGDTTQGTTLQKGAGVLKRSWAKRKEKNLLRKAQQRALQPLPAGAPTAPPILLRTSPRLSPRAMPAAALLPPALLPPPLPPPLQSAPLPPPRATAAEKAAERAVAARAAADRAVEKAAAAERAAAAAAAAAAIAPPRAPVPTSSAAAVPGWAPPSWEVLYDTDAIERRVQPLLGEAAIGIDIEWRPTFVAGRPPNPVALLQLSSRSLCVLVPIRHLRKPFPPSLSTILASPRVVKLGCGVSEDARKLLSDCGLACTPTLEIGEVAVRLQREEGIAFPGLGEGEQVRPGLRGLCLACGFDLEKPKKLSRSNWERRPLLPDQQRYAAYDAYAGVWIARCLHALHAPKQDFGAWLAQQAHQLKLYAAAQGVAKAANKSARKRAGGR